MRLKTYTILITLMLCSLSCSSKKDILYVQGLDSTKNYSSNYKEYKINVDDILKIDIKSRLPEITAEFNTNPNLTSVSKDIIKYNGYMVNSYGNIYIPAIGEIFVEGLTIIELRKKIIEGLKEQGYFTDNLSIDIKTINTYFTILGEVNSPGKFDYLGNNLNILEALGMAGDLTINGERRDIKIIRDSNGKRLVYSVDLTDSDILLSDGFQIFPKDIIIVNPNSTRVKNAGIIGNSGTLLSLLSFILSSIIVISR